MKNILTLAVLSILASSCVNLNGDLVVSEKMTLKKRGGFLNLQRKDVSVETGTYTADLKANSANNFSLELNQGNNKISIPIKSSNSKLNIPQNNGEFSISHADIDQPYDLKGNLVTNVDSTPTQEAIENCTWYTTERICHDECDKAFNGPDAGRGGDHRGGDQRGGDNRGGDQRPVCHDVCEDISISHPGSQDVVFHYTTVTKNIVLDFLTTDSPRSVAEFRGTNSETNRIVESASICR